MGQKNNIMCDYLEKPDKFADFINGSLYQGREVFVKQKASYREGDKINMCKAMKDWEEEILKEGVEKGIEQGIEALILDNLDEGISETRIIEKLQKHFSLNEREAQNCFAKYAVCH